MPIYVRKVTELEAYQWDGNVPFRPAPNFDPPILAVPSRMPPTEYEILISRFDSYPVTKDCYIVKDRTGKYSAMAKEEFEALYKKVEEDNE